MIELAAVAVAGTMLMYPAILPGWTGWPWPGGDPSRCCTKCSAKTKTSSTYQLLSSRSARISRNPYWPIKDRHSTSGSGLAARPEHIRAARDVLTPRRAPTAPSPPPPPSPRDRWPRTAHGAAASRALGLEALSTAREARAGHSSSSSGRSRWPIPAEPRRIRRGSPLIQRTAMDGGCQQPEAEPEPEREPEPEQELRLRRRSHSWCETTRATCASQSVLSASPDQIHVI